MRTLVSLSAAIALLLSVPAGAARYECSQPVSNGSIPAASDCLRILQVAVGSQSCFPACMCAPTGGASAKASDALICLKKAVGQNQALSCACSIVRVHYPAGSAQHITFSAISTPSALPKPGSPCDSADDKLWICNLGALTGSRQGKPLLNGMHEARGTNWKVPVPGSIDIFPFFVRAEGEVEILADVASNKLGNSRDVAVYLPPSYEENTLKQYPVLFMQDGQDLFDPATAFGGTEWQVDEWMDVLAVERNIREMIIVAPYASAARISEYTPTEDGELGIGGDGHLYLDFLLDELAPVLAESYRVDAGQKPGIAGSSLGGLISLYGAWTRWPDFAAVAALSPSLYWDDEYLLKLVSEDGTPPVGLDVYIDVGDAEPAESVTRVAELRDILLGKGWEIGEDLRHVVGSGHAHDASYWGARMPGALSFLYEDPARVSD